MIFSNAYVQTSTEAEADNWMKMSSPIEFETHQGTTMHTLLSQAMNYDLFIYFWWHYIIDRYSLQDLSISR